MVGIKASTGTSLRKARWSLEVRDKQFDLKEEYLSFFRADLTETMGGVLLGLELKKIAADSNLEKNRIFETGPGPCQIAITSLYFVL